MRGLAFSITGFFSALTSALSPLVIGFIADRFDYVVDGEVKGNLANAFLIVTPLVFVGAACCGEGRRHMTADLLPRRGSVIADEPRQSRSRPSILMALPRRSL